MTFEDRVAKAEKYIRERTGWHGLGEEMLREVFADLYGEKPTAWIAPWDLDPLMESAAEESPHGDSYHYAAPRHQWPAMRDAYLKRT